MTELSSHLLTALPWLVLATPASLALAMTLFNLLLWPRGRNVASTSASGAAPSISVLIPARDEEDNIEACLRAIDASLGEDLLEIIVYDDRSSDDTPTILARLRQEMPTLHVKQGVPLPQGWVGKPHACHQLAADARGELLLYVDADVTLHPGALQRLQSLLEDYRADLVTVVPRQIMGSLAERLIMPLLHLTYTSWFPLPLIWRSQDPRFLAANGQVLGIRRSCYGAIGGFEAVRQEVVDDMAICRAAKLGGHRVVFAEGSRIADCRMYEDARGIVEGFSKNLYEGIGGHPLALLVVILLYSLTFLLPYLALPAALLVQAPASWAMAAGAGLLANLTLRLVLALRLGHPLLLSLMLHPLAVVGLLGIAINSWRWDRRNTITWAGRTYQSRAQRNTP